jgi:hypothetical protein
MLLSAPADGRYCNRAHITNGVSVSDVNNGEPRICGILGLPASNKKRWNQKTRQTHWPVSDTVASLTVAEVALVGGGHKPTKIVGLEKISQCHSLLFPSASEA